jgi:hypothetical protein
MEPESIAGLLGQAITAALVPLVGIALAWLRRWHINETVLKAVTRGAGAAYMTMVEDKRAGISGAVEVGAAYVERRVPTALARAGVDSDALRELVKSHLGTLLPADPSFRVEPPPEPVKRAPTVTPRRRK